MLIVCCIFSLTACAGLGTRAVETEQVSATIAPKKIHEVCYEMGKGQSLEYRFEASQPLDFNLHYHAGAVVEYPVEKKGTRGAEGSYAVPFDQIYCLMWTNNASNPVRLDGTATIRRQIRP